MIISIAFVHIAIIFCSVVHKQDNSRIQPPYINGNPHVVVVVVVISFYMLMLLNTAQFIACYSAGLISMINTFASLYRHTFLTHTHTLFCLFSILSRTRWEIKMKQIFKKKNNKTKQCLVGREERANIKNAISRPRTVCCSAELVCVWIRMMRVGRRCCRRRRGVAATAWMCVCVCCLTRNNNSQQ